MATVGAIYAEIRATTSGLRRDMADAVAITKQGTESMSQILDQFGKPVFSGINESARRLRGPLLDVDSSLRGLAETAKGLAGPLASELGPAFDGIGIRIAHVLTTSASLGNGMTALALAAAGLAGVIGGTLAAAWKKNAEEAAAFQTALNSVDTNKIAGEIDKLLVKLEATAKNLRTLQGFEFPATQPGINPRTGEPRIPLGFLPPTPTGAAKSERDRILEELRKAREAERAAITGSTEAAAFAAQKKQLEDLLVATDKAEREAAEKRLADQQKLAEELGAGERAIAERDEAATNAAAPQRQRDGDKELAERQKLAEDISAMENAIAD